MKLPVILKVLFGAALAFGIVLVLAVVLFVSRRPDAVPHTPEQTAEQFVLDLAAHRYDGAVDYLAQGIMDEVSIQDLQILVSTIEAHQQGIRSASGSDTQTKGDILIVRVNVQFNSGVHRYLDLPVINEDGTWKVSSIDPLWGMILFDPDIEMLNG